MLTEAVPGAPEGTLLRSDLAEPGIRRRRRGRGFRYFAPDGTPLADAATLARVKALVIPPATRLTTSQAAVSGTSRREARAA